MESLSLNDLVVDGTLNTTNQYMINMMNLGTYQEDV